MTSLPAPAPSATAVTDLPADTLPADTLPADTLPADTEVLVVGAGLAGLACAVHLLRAGIPVVVVESSDDVGGRVRSDVVDGYRCERGFQLLNPAYPEVAGVLDVAALELCSFPAGVRLTGPAAAVTVLDPRRSSPHAAVSAAVDAARRLRVGSPTELAALVRWLLDAGRHDGATLLARPDEPWGAALERRGVRGPLRDGVLVPFLAGVLGEDAGATSHRFVQLLIRSFLRGTPAIPAAGMQAIPRDLARRLPAGSVVTGCPVEDLVTAPAGWTARTPRGSVRARAVVVATDPATAARLAGTADPGARSLTTFWFGCPQDPQRDPALTVDTLRRGPVVNSVDVALTVPGVAPAGRGLVAATVLGAGATAPGERDVRAHLCGVHGGAVQEWELVEVSSLPRALTVAAAPLDARRAVDLGGGRFVCGDHRDTPSIQGALVSGRRAATAVAAHLGRSRPGVPTAGGHRP